MKHISIAAVASDAGGARAIIPVLKHASVHGYKVSVLFSGPSVSLLETLPTSINGESIEDDLSIDEACLRLAEAHPDLLLSACGLYNKIEHTVRLAAKQLHIPTLGLLDSWLNYRERFTRPQSELLYPDHVCAIDETSMQGMVDAGMSASDVSNTGHPDLEVTAKLLTSSEQTLGTPIRESVNLPEETQLFVFLSDPFYDGPNYTHYTGPGALMHDDSSPVFGYTTASILPVTAKAISNSLQETGQEAVLVLRPHPSEWVTPLYEFAKNFDHPNLEIRVVEEHSTQEWLAAADAVFGMMTIALLHSAFLKRPTFSIQIGLEQSGEEDPCVATQLGYVPLILSEKDLQFHCLQLLLKPDNYPMKSTPSTIPLEGSTQRVFETMQELITRHSVARHE